MGHEGFGGNDGWVFGNFEWDASHENHDPDRIFLRLLDREIVGEAEDGVRKDGFAALQPSAGYEDFVEGLADFGFEVEAGNFFCDGAIDSEEAVGRNGAGFGVRFRERLGIGIGSVVNDDGMCGQIGSLRVSRGNRFRPYWQRKGDEKKDWKEDKTARHSERVEEKGWREKITGSVARSRRPGGWMEGEWHPVRRGGFGG